VRRQRFGCYGMFYRISRKGRGMGTNLHAGKPKRIEYADSSEHVNNSESRFGCRQMELWAKKRTYCCFPTNLKQKYFVYILCYACICRHFELSNKNKASGLFVLVCFISRRYCLPRLDAHSVSDG